MHYLLCILHCAINLVESIGDGCHDANLLDVGGILVAIVYFELTLSGCLNASQVGLAGIGKGNA